MPTPYHPTVTELGGTVVVFPVLKRGQSDPDLVDAVNALFYDDSSRWPQDGGSAVPLATRMVDSPDAHKVVNWLAVNDPDTFLPGVIATLPDVTLDDASGTVPYVNPALSSNPDAIIALNYLLDNSGAF